MMRLCVLILLLSLTPIVCQAQAADQAFTRVPPSDPAYTDLTRLSQAGITADPHQYFLSTGGQGTRYNFALITADLLNVLQDKGTPQQTTTLNSTILRIRLEQHPQAIAALIALGQEFQPELVHLGVNWNTAQKRLNMLAASADINMLQRAGFVISDLPEGAMTGRPIDTPQQFTASVGDFLTDAFPSGKALPRIQQHLKENVPALAALTHLVDQFAPELAARGFNIPVIHEQLISFATGPRLTVAPKFTDVPRRHWAYSSVEALRKAGIIRGEGGRQFN